MAQSLVGARGDGGAQRAGVPVSLGPSARACVGTGLWRLLPVGHWRPEIGEAASRVAGGCACTPLPPHLSQAPGIHPLGREHTRRLPSAALACMVEPGRPAGPRRRLGVSRPAVCLVVCTGFTSWRSHPAILGPSDPQAGAKASDLVVENVH